VLTDFWLRVASQSWNKSCLNQLASANKSFDLGFLMNRLQTRLSQSINQKTGRKNHVFGGQYKATLIDHPTYYAHALRYLYQNPVRAGVVENVENYVFSTLKQFLFEENECSINLTAPPGGLDEYLLNRNSRELLDWIQNTYSDTERETIRKALSKTCFAFPRDRKTRRLMIPPI
jgi:putative transposase